MKYNIKKKVVNGQLLYGIIDDNLETVLPFEYANIEEKTASKGENAICYLVTSQDDKKNMFLNHHVWTPGHLQFETGYDYIEYLPGYSNNYNNPFIVGKMSEQGMQYAIVESYYDQRGNDTYEEKILYPFGKADEIKNVNGKIELYKKSGDVILKGVFGDSEIGTFDPVYTRLDLKKYNISHWPLLDRSDEKVFLYNGSRNPIMILETSNIKDGEEVKGMLVYNGEWKELLSCEYSGYKMDRDNCLIHLTKKQGEKQLHGLLGFTDTWDINYGSNGFVGKCTFEERFSIPCEYDSIQIIFAEDNQYDWQPSKGIYAIVQKDGKYGLFRIVTNFTTSNRKSFRESKVEQVLDCVYDSIGQLDRAKLYSPRITDNSFIIGLDGKKGIFVDKYKEESLKTDCGHKNISKLVSRETHHGCNAYVITDENDKKALGTIIKDEEMKTYGLSISSFMYDSISSSYHGYTNSDDNRLIVAKKTTGEKTKYDIYKVDESALVDTKPFLTDVDGIEYGANGGYFVSTTYTRLDNGLVRIVILDTRGNVVFDESLDKEATVNYEALLESCVVNENDIARVVKSNSKLVGYNLEESMDLSGSYSTFNVVNPNPGYSKERIIGYRKTPDDKMGLYKVSAERSSNSVVESLLPEEYESIEIVCDGTRSIVSKLDSDFQTTKYGVVENKQGNECIALEYDSINLGKDEDDNEVFVATSIVDGVTQQFVFDTDGFVIGDNTVGDGTRRLVLTNPNQPK